MHLRLGRGSKRGQLGPVAHQLPQLPHRRWSDPRLGNVVAAQPVRQLGGVLHIVFDPAGIPMQPQRVDQMHPGTFRGQEIGRPIPPIARLQRHLGVRARLSHRHSQRHRIVIDLRHLQHLAGIVHPNDHRPAPMQIDTHVLLLMFHQGLLPSFTGWLGDPECALHTRFPSTGGALAVHHRPGHRRIPYTARRPQPAPPDQVTQKRRCASS